MKSEMKSETKSDVIVAGVGGQGVLSVAAIIAVSAVKQGLYVRQAEVHGMAQRGGAVISHLRICQKPIASTLIPRGGADLILSLEPLEGIRSAAHLSCDGVIVSAAESFVNIPNYPELSGLHAMIRKFPRHFIVEATSLAREAGLARAVNMVMAGAASRFIPIPIDVLLETIREVFSRKDEAIAAANERAFRLGFSSGAAGKETLS